MSHIRRSCPSIPSHRSAWSRQPLLALAIGLGLALAAPQAASADAAAIAPLAKNEAKNSFERFASSWMEKMRGLEKQNRAKPTVHAQGERSQVSYRGYGDEFETELRPTEHPSAPYIGILRYTERLYTCSDAKAKRCTISATTPVTEIFRFQGGKWIY